jgi:hypothetical protein
MREREREREREMPLPKNIVVKMSKIQHNEDYKNGKRKASSHM